MVMRRFTADQVTFLAGACQDTRRVDGDIERRTKGTRRGRSQWSDEECDGQEE